MPSPPKIAKSTGNGSSSSDYNSSYAPPQKPRYHQGGAPAGPTFGSDLPVKSVSGGKPFRIRGR